MKKRIVSYLLFFIPFIFILNFFFGWISTGKVEGLPMFFPIIFCPFGMVFASAAKQKGPDKWATVAMWLHLSLFFFPFIYMIAGTIIEGV